MADPPPERQSPEAFVISGQSGGPSEAADTIVQITAVAREIAKVAANALVAPVLVQNAAETTAPALAGPPPSAQPASPQPKPATPAAKGKVAAGPDKHTARAARERLAAAPPAVRVVGKSETGTAAWYGGRYVGRRTTSGATLDNVHATAAHRTLPLNCLARVTNLRNGRSVVVRVTDRGPVGNSLLIDMSPRAAEMLQMKEAGLAPVRVEQVVELSPDTK